MRQCLTRGVHPRRSGWLFHGSRWKNATLVKRNFTITKQCRIGDHASDDAEFWLRRYNVFKRIRAPERAKNRNPAAWASLLESGLPPHLRQNGDTEAATNLDASDIAEIILAAQSQTSGRTQIDVLCHLGIEQGRWREVVWLVKYLVEAFAPSHMKPLRLTKSLSTWTDVASLDEITSEVIDVQTSIAPRKDATITSVDLMSLNDLTDDLKPEKLSREAMLWHEAMGSIWRSIGLMTINCAGGEIQPEILEIIAYLHHMEIMPTSIYNQKPSPDPTAIQQPLMLSLFSSRILTSLSDAAWRAHAKSVVEEAKTKREEKSTLRPEIPGMAYRVHVAGLRPEVWLELILWSCLHGGWISQGTTILRALYDVTGKTNKVRRWRPVSWRSLMDYSEHSQDWDQFEYLFNTEHFAAGSSSQIAPGMSMRRTISSEVVNAYVDALLSTIRMGVGERGSAPGTVLGHLYMLHKFLERSDSKLETGSWDAVVLRFVDTAESVINQRKNFDWLVGLSPAMGEELQRNDSRALPAYVFDGSAAVFGLFHQALRSRVRAGNVRGALQLFESLQTLADKNKHQSVVDFLQKQQLLANDGTDDMFTNNFSGIEYPAFDVQIPITIVGPFLELIADAKAYEFGRWLLYSDEIDGPVLPEEHYGNPAVAPALVRFASETQDTALLSKVIKARSLQPQPGEPLAPRNVLQSFFESQVNLHRWDAARRVLDHMKNEQYASWNAISLAHIIRVMLRQVRGSTDGDESSVQNLAEAKNLVRDMVLGKYDPVGGRARKVEYQIPQLLTMLATIDRSWAEFASNMRPLQGAHTFNLSVKAFNLVLEGVVDAYGSRAGRRLLETFWPRHIRSAQKRGERRASDDAGEPKMSRFIPSVMDQSERQRRPVKIPGHPAEKVVVYGGLEPNLMTIQIIFNKTVNELKGEENHKDDSLEQTPESTSLNVLRNDRPDDTLESSASGTAIWAMRCLRSLGLAHEDIRDQMFKAMSEIHSGEIKERFRAVMDEAGLDITANDRVE